MQTLWWVQMCHGKSCCRERLEGFDTHASIMRPSRHANPVTQGFQCRLSAVSWRIGGLGTLITLWSFSSHCRRD